MDKKEDFAERRRRQKEKLSLQRAERRIAESMPRPPSAVENSKPSDRPFADSPGSSENTDDAYVHVDKADAEEAEVVSAQPPESSGDIGGATRIAAGPSTVTKPAPSPVQQSVQQPVGLSTAARPASKTAEAMGKLQVSTQALPNQSKTLAASCDATEAPETTNLQAAVHAPSLKHPAAPAVRHQLNIEEHGHYPRGQMTERLRPAKGAVSGKPESSAQSPEQKQDVQLGASSARASASSIAPKQQVAAARPDKSAMGGRDAEEAGKPDRDSGIAGKQAGGAASSGSWGWGKGWLPTAALQQVAAGALKDVQEMKQSLQQAFAAEEPETTTDEDESMPEELHGAPAGASEAERRAVLERLQGQDNHVAASFKLLDRQIDTVLGGAAGLAGSLFGRAHSAGRQVAGKVEAGLELFGQSAIRLLDGGMDYSGLPPNTFASHFRHNGGSDLAGDVEELCNDSARLCNRLRSLLKGAELEAFNADVASMAAYLDTASLAGAAADQKDGSCPEGVPDIDPLIIAATCRRGAERLKAWHGRKIDGFALWGLHDSACAELAEAAALCVEAFKTFSIELSGSAAAKVGSQPAATAFSTVANYLQSKTSAMVAALILLADAHLAIADKAAAEALAAFKAQQGSASSKQGGAREGAAHESSAPGAAEAQQASSSSAGKASMQRYPDHVHDPLKVQLELGNVKEAALQCVTELYRGLLYVALHHCHGQRRL